MKPQHSTLGRLIHAANYSKQGLVAVFNSEAAFRQELFLYLLLLPVIWLIPLSVEFKLLLFAVNSLVLIVEIVNSAIESVVDLVSPGFNEYAKKAKDMGSAAVFVSLLLSAALWFVATIQVIL